ncbi:MAG TPA: SHOCT domain-containing protein [Nitrososphaeraceae archaeon]|nr:SHOCT domain-containing protein [Nitrososphaeraceae archaeon]
MVDIPYDIVTSVKLEKGLLSSTNTVPPTQPISIADEIRKLAKLKEEGIITEEEFKQMKQDLIRKNN